MIAAYNTALTGLQAFGTKLQANGNNIANANTDSFKKSVVTNSEVAPLGVKAEVYKNSTRGPESLPPAGTAQEIPVELSTVDLATELVDMKVNSTLYKANLKTIETVNDMTGTLLQLKS